jgi:hypothetical protein
MQGPTGSYLTTGGKLLTRFIREYDVQGLPAEDVDPREFVSWLVGLKLSIANSTFRRYRASAIAIPSGFANEAVAMLQHDFQVGDDATEINRKCRELRSPKHPNRFEHHHFGEVKKQMLVCSGGQARDWLRDWPEAGIITGLRPMEWALIDLERRPISHAKHDRVWLHVVSGKGGLPSRRIPDCGSF